MTSLYELQAAAAKGQVMHKVHVAGPDDVHTHADELSALRHANEINKAFLADLLKHPNPADQVLCVATVHGEATGNELLAWACGRWRDEVQDRPLINKNRRPLDDTWRQVVRYAGGNPDELLGPSHDALLAILELTTKRRATGELFDSAADAAMKETP